MGSQLVWILRKCSDKYRKATLFALGNVVILYVVKPLFLKRVALYVGKSSKRKLDHYLRNV